MKHRFPEGEWPQEYLQAQRAAVEDGVGNKSPMSRGLMISDSEFFLMKRFYDHSANEI